MAVDSVAGTDGATVTGVMKMGEYKAIHPTKPTVPY